MLCGVSPAFEDVRSVPVLVDGAEVRLRWPMPFEREAAVYLLNTSNEPVSLQAAAETGPFTAAGKFCGAYSRFENLQADKLNRLTLAQIGGSGRIVGCALRVVNRSGAWWGEGDPMIYLDNFETPAWRGTGTEDYFGYAWCSASCFQHPLRGQPKPAMLYRYHLLDTLPFQNGARFDFEAHGTGGGRMDYSALVLWYSETSAVNRSISWR